MNKEIENLRQKAKQLWEREKWDELIPVATELIRLEEEHVYQARAYFYRGNAYFMKGDYDDAIAACTKAIDLNSEDSEAYRMRGHAYFMKGDYDDAIADCTKAIDLNSEASEAYRMRGFAYDHKGNHDDAIADCTKAIDLNSEDSDAYFIRGHAYFMKRKYDLAITDCTKAIDLNPEDSEAYCIRGRAYFMKRKYDLAITDCTKAIDLNPEDSRAYHIRGCAYAIKRKYDRAITDYDKGIDLNSEDSRAYYIRGYAYFQKGDYDHAFKDLNKAAEKDQTLKNRYPYLYIASQIYAIHDLKGKEEIQAFEICIRLFDAVDEIQNELFYQLEESGKESEVAHYTSLHVLKNLSARKGRFRLYNAAYMNDPEEGQVFFKTMKEKGGIDIEGLFYRDDDRPGHVAVYIGSFARLDSDDQKDKQKDKLFLWRTYGKHDAEEAAGACLIFNKRCFAESLPRQFGRMTEYAQLIDGVRNDAQRPLELHKVYYRNADQELDKKLEELSDKLHDVNNFIGNLSSEQDKEQDKLRELVCELLDSIRFLFKEKHYSEENEVRVIQLRYGKGGEDTESDIRIDVENIPPRFYLQAPENFRPDTVILGPRTRRFQEWERWLKQQDDGIKIEQSEIKFGKP